MPISTLHIPATRRSTVNKAVVLSAIGLLALSTEIASFLPDARWVIQQTPAFVRSEVDEIQAPATRARGDQEQALRTEDEIQAPRSEDDIQAPRSEGKIKAPRGLNTRTVTRSVVDGPSAS
jgi:hypothetical protein